MIIGQVIVQRGEAIPIVEDFANELAPGETIAQAAVTSRNAATGTSTTTTFLADGPPAAISGTTVATQKRVDAGTHGETHIVQIKITTSGGNLYEHEIEVTVIET